MNNVGFIINTLRSNSPFNEPIFMKRLQCPFTIFVCILVSTLWEDYILDGWPLAIRMAFS